MKLFEMEGLRGKCILVDRRFDYRLGRETIYEPVFVVAEHIESFLFAGVSHIKMTSGEKIVVRETPEEISRCLASLFKRIA
jgi:uncharacterized protein YlzI (FlbEa/FlbD family)